MIPDLKAAIPLNSSIISKADKLIQNVKEGQPKDPKSDSLPK